VEKIYGFKNYFEGSNKTTGKPFRILELHDYDTWTNTTYYLKPGQQLPELNNLKIKDKVIVTHGVETYQNKPQLTVEAIRKA
jgi:hypothetical protein